MEGITYENPAPVPVLDLAHDPGTIQANIDRSSTHGMSSKMKAVHYEGPFKVSVREVEMPKIEHPDDVIVKVTTAGMHINCMEDKGSRTDSVQQFVGPICICIKDEQRRKKDLYLVMKIWVLSSRQVPE
jgi:hypothetical protein